MHYGKCLVYALASIALLALLGCEPAASGSGARVEAEFTPCRSGAAKEAAPEAMESGTAILVYQSRDSLHIHIDSLYLQCQSKFAVVSPVLLSSQELSLQLSRTMNSGAKCVCNQPLDLRIRAAGEDFSAVEVLYLEGNPYELSSSKKK